MGEFDADTLLALRDLIINAEGDAVPQGGNTPYVVIPDDHKVVNLADYVHNDRSERPIRKKGTVKVFDGESFCEYFSHFCDLASRVFADETKSTVLAILDYHETSGGGPRWGQHRIELTLRHSEEWQTWTGADGQNHKMSQVEFAEFIEDNAPDIVNPNGATMLEIARTLSAKNEVDFGSAIRTSNGSITLKYSEQVKGTYGNGQVDVPEQFTISIPIYIGILPGQITARLRYRINSGKLTFWYDLLRADAAKRDAFLAIRGGISANLNVPIINGVPA